MCVQAQFRLEPRTLPMEPISNIAEFTLLPDHHTGWGSPDQAPRPMLCRGRGDAFRARAVVLRTEPRSESRPMGAAFPIAGAARRPAKRLDQ